MEDMGFGMSIFARDQQEKDVVARDEAEKATRAYLNFELEYDFRECRGIVAGW